VGDLEDCPKEGLMTLPWRKRDILIAFSQMILPVFGKASRRLLERLKAWFQDASDSARDLGSSGSSAKWVKR